MSINRSLILSKGRMSLNDQSFVPIRQQYLYESIIPKYSGSIPPAKHSSGGVTDGRTDKRTDRQTDDGQSDPYVSLCFAGDTKIHFKAFGISSS